MKTYTLMLAVVIAAVNGGRAGGIEALRPSASENLFIPELTRINSVSTGKQPLADFPEPKAERDEDAKPIREAAVKTFEWNIHFGVTDLPSGDYDITGNDAGLKIRKFHQTPFSVEYKGLGKILEQEFTFEKPLSITNNTFGNKNTLALSAPGILLTKERLAGWRELTIGIKVEENFPLESAVLIMNMLSLTPNLWSMPAVSGKVSLPQSRADSNITCQFRQVSADLMTATGQNMNLRIERRSWGNITDYRVTGKAFGRNLGYGEDELVVTMFGAKDYRIKGCGITMDARYSEFGRTKVLDITGTPGNSREIMLFAQSLINYILSGGMIY